MRRSTKHALLQRLVALVGFVLFVGPIWGVAPFALLPPWFVYLGFLVFLVGLLSALGVGPWGRHYASLYVAEHRTENRRGP